MQLPIYSARVHDWDLGARPVQADLKIEARLAKVIMVANRNGFFLHARPRIWKAAWWPTRYRRIELGQGNRQGRRPHVLDNIGTEKNVLPDNHCGTNFQPPTYDRGTEGIVFCDGSETCATWQGVKPTDPIGMGCASERRESLV